MAAVAAVATVAAAKRPVLGVVWVDSAATVVCDLAGAVVCADVLRVVKSVDLVTTMTTMRVVMVVGIGSSVAVVLGGWRSVANDAAAFSRGGICGCNISHNDALSDDAVLAGKILHELRLSERPGCTTIGGCDQSLVIDRAS